MSCLVPGEETSVWLFVKMYEIRNVKNKQYFSYIVAVSFIAGGNRSTWRKPLTCRKSVTNFNTPCHE